MRVVTVVGSISSGKTCLLNILQEKAKDGRVFSIKEQQEISIIQEEFEYNAFVSNYKTAAKLNRATTVLVKEEHLGTQKKENKKRVARARLKFSNKVVPENIDTSNNIEDINKDSKVGVERTGALLDSKRSSSLSNLLGKTPSTIGVNHFEFVVDDLTLQVAGEYWRRKGKKNCNLCPSGGCDSTNVHNEQFDTIELRELGGQIGM